MACAGGMGALHVVTGRVDGWRRGIVVDFREGRHVEVCVSRLIQSSIEYQALLHR